MGTRVIYTCDRCKSESEDKKPMWNIRLKIEHLDTTPQRFGAWEAPTAMWCRPCVDSLQLLGPPKQVEPPAELPKEISLEDKLRAICQEEIENALDNR